MILNDIFDPKTLVVEFAPAGSGDDREPDEEAILQTLASRWWLGNEQDMIRAQKTLAAMGWEIGEDEGYDNGGVFVVRSGDEHGKSYISWPHEDLQLDENWKHRLAGAALAGAMALGAGGAHARVTGDEDPSINRLTGKPIATQVTPSAEQPAAAVKKGFSAEYLKSVIDGSHPRPLISKERAQELLKQQEVKEVSDRTLTSYLTKVHADSQKHPADPTKRDPQKANRGVAGFSKAFNRLDSRKSDGSLNEFAPTGGGDDSGNYFQALASAWYNGTYDSGSLQKGIKSQQDIERLLQRGIVCPDGVTRKFGIDYNSDFDGVVISSDDYYEHADDDDTIDSRTGKPFGPYDYMEFGGEELDESAKWRDPKYKDQLYTQEKPDYNDTREYDRARWDPKPKGYAGRKELPGGDEYDRTDPLVRGAGIGRTGIKNNILDRGKRKGLPSRDQITSLKQSIRDISGRHVRANLPEQGMAEGLPQTLRKIVPGYAKREIDKKMDAEKFGRTDVDRDANYWRYKKIQDKLKEQGVAEGSDKPVHRIGLTVTDPNHPMVSKRGETIQKTVRVPGHDPAKAINAAIAHHRRKGYKVHDHHYMGTVDDEPIDEGKQQKGADYRDPPETDYDATGHDASVARLKHLAGVGPMKTVYDPNKRVYKNMPTAVQPKRS